MDGWFQFQCRFIDFLLSLRVPIANKPYMLLGLGAAMAVVYYFASILLSKIRPNDTWQRER